MSKDILENRSNSMQRYFKVITENSLQFGCREAKFKPGLNVYNAKLDEDNMGGFYFTDIQHIFAYLNYGDFVAEVFLPDDAIYEEDGESMSIDSEYIIGWKSNKIILSEFMDLRNLDTIKYLISKGANISCDDYLIINWSKNNNYTDILEYVQSMI